MGVQYVQLNPAGEAARRPRVAGTLKTYREQMQEKRRAQRAAANPMAKYAADGRPIGANIQFGGPEDAWTKLAHALFQTNEATFIN